MERKKKFLLKAVTMEKPFIVLRGLIYKYFKGNLSKFEQRIKVIT